MNKAEYLHEISKLTEHALASQELSPFQKTIITKAHSFLLVSLTNNTDMEYTFFPAATLPVTGVTLVIKLKSGEVVKGNRPNYIASRNQEDLGYRSLDGEYLDALEWAYA
jgi:hypothetical protein